MRRREFLKQTGVAVAASVMAPPFVHASDKSGSKPPIVGKGEHTYECHHNFGKVPDHIHWYETHGVAVDKAGFVYVTHRGGDKIPDCPDKAQDTVVVFDPAGKFVRSFGKEYHGGGHGIDVREENGKEYLYLACMMPVNIVLKTDLEGEVVWKKEKPTESHVYDDPKAKFAPTNFAFAPDGGFYLADGYGSNYIHEFDKDAKWVRTFGGTGETDGKFRTPHGLWLDNRPGRDPMLVVADRANQRLQYMKLNGEFSSISHHDKESFPAHFDTRGEVLLVPDLYARISLYDKNNEAITHLGYTPEWTKELLADKFKMRKTPETCPAGKFLHPHDACFDKEGNIYVAEWVATGRVSFLRRVG